MYAYKILPATGIRLSGNVTRRTKKTSLHKPGTILGITIRRSSHRPFCRIVATNNFTWTRVCVTFKMTIVKQRLSNKTAKTAKTHAHQWELPPNQPAWLSRVKMNNRRVVIKASSMPSTKTQQTLPHKDGVKSKCKNPAMGKELAGAATILGIGNAVVVGDDVVVSEDAAVAATAAVAVLLLLLCNDGKKVVAVVGIAEEVGLLLVVVLVLVVAVSPSPQRHRFRRFAFLRKIPFLRQTRTRMSECSEAFAGLKNGVRFFSVVSKTPNGGAEAY
jgi:hypothetical protein